MDNVQNGFTIRWDEFSRNVAKSLASFREDSDFFDVTLACDGRQLEAHKLVLSASSSFFRNILRRNPHQHPLIYLKGIKYAHLISIVNFMYNGQC